MYKVMIVDDEPIVSLMIKSISNWEENSIEIAFEASNGKEALKILEQQDDVDIIITDLNMPVMDGIELITNLKNLKNNIPIIVLSAYEDYPLIRSAFKLGAEDYILKTEINESNLLELLKSIIKGLKEKHNNKGEVKKISDSDLRAIKHNILKDLIYNGIDEKTKENIEKNKLRITDENIIIFSIFIDDFYNVKERFNDEGLKSFIISVLNVGNQILLRENRGEIISLASNEYVIFYSFNNKENFNLREKIKDLTKVLKDTLFNYVNISISIGVSNVESGYENIKYLYEEANKNAKFRFVLGKGKVIFSKDIEKGGYNSYTSIIGEADQFIKSLKSEEIESIKSELEILLKLIEKGSYENLEKIYVHYAEIIFIIINYVKELNVDINKVLDYNMNPYEKINSFETYMEVNTWIRCIVEKVVLYMKEKSNEKYSYTIIRAINFIQENYQNEFMSIKLVSNYVELSENYFSVLFSNECGETFKDYLINLRINKAKYLIEHTNMKIYEICENVGYKNVEHFSRIFKKVTGKSPNNFKKHGNPIKGQ